MPKLQALCPEYLNDFLFKYLISIKESTLRLDFNSTFFFFVFFVLSVLYCLTLKVSFKTFRHTFLFFSFSKAPLQHQEGLKVFY